MGTRALVHANAFYWAQVIGGPGAVPYCTLKPGDRFRFPGHEDTKIKLRGNKYRTAAGSQWWITGRLTAVIPVKEQQQANSRARGGQC